jgi:ribonucleoside-diphosphate reductase alpha chain
MAVHEDVLHQPRATKPALDPWVEVGLGGVAEGLSLPDAASFLREVARGGGDPGGGERARLVRAAAARVSACAPDWQFVAARLLLEDLYATVARARGGQGGYGHLGAHMRALSARGLYDERVLAAYGREEVDELEGAMQPERDRLFTYAGLKHLVDRYLLQDEDGGPVELPQEMFMGVAMTLALAERERVRWARTFYDALSRLELTVATPTLRNARRPSGQLSSCFVDTPEDSLMGIFGGLRNFAQVSKHGGGMGVYLGKLRARGAAIQGHRGAAGGVIPWVRLYNDTAVSVDQLGQRAGAVSLWLDVWHRDIVDFLDLKTNNGDDRRKAYDVFPGVCVPDLFYRAVEAGQDWSLFDPHEVLERQGFALEDSWGPAFEARYRQCVEDRSLSRVTMRALDLMALIMKSAYETGGPFIFHRDTANRLNPNGHAGIVYCSNLCTEIVQNQSQAAELGSALDGDLVTSRARPGDFVVCNLASLNLGRLLDAQALGRAVPTAVRMLDDAISVNHLPLPQAARTNARYRAIGLGTSGYHEHLVRRGIAWQSEAHVAYANGLYEEIAYLAIGASAELARERGAYALFQGSDWQSGAYFDKRGYDGGRWHALKATVAQTGMRNGYLLAVAPTGSTSVIAGTTAAVDPVFRRVFTEERRGMIVRQVAPGLSPATEGLYAEAHHVDQRWTLKAAAARQRHIDQSQSVNLYATPDLDGVVFLDLYLEAWRSGMKTVYYFRNFDGDAEACDACSA